MKIILFTYFFPYKRSEPFLINEFGFTKKYAKAIKVFTLYGRSPENILDKVDQDLCFSPVLKSAADKRSLFFKGIFNLAPFHFHFAEFFKQKLFLYPHKCYWFFVSLLITRSALSSAAYKQLLHELKEKDETLLYFYWGDNLCWILPYLEKAINKRNVRIIMRLHANDLYENVKADYAALRSRIFGITDRLYSVSENGKIYLQKKYPASANKINVSRLGVKDHGLNPYKASDKKVLVSVSNLVTKKRVHYIFEALQASSLNIVWHHFGDGPLMPALKEQCGSARQGLNINLHGHVKNEEVMRFLASNSIDLFLNVSFSEGLPVSIMEAFSFGIPAVATDAGGTADLVSDETGYLLDTNPSREEIKDQIEKVLSKSEAEIQQLRSNARRTFIEKVSLGNYDVFYSEIKELFATK